MLRRYDVVLWQPVRSSTELVRISRISASVQRGCRVIIVTDACRIADVVLSSATYPSICLVEG